MTYYRAYEYSERYFVRFKDIDNNDWRISIQQPNFSGTAIELTGAEFPVQWEGKGTDKQDEVMCGSTGNLRLVCQNTTQASQFKIGKLLPENINERRVQVLRYTATNTSGTNMVWAVYWQGFIKPEIYSQDWDRTPYEIELPIVSTVAAMEYFPIPVYGDNEYDLFTEQTNIAGLLRATIIASGSDIKNIITNLTTYYNFSGDITLNTGGGLVHWSQGVVSSSFFYSYDDGVLKPKTFKDIWETICYPYGKVQEFEQDIAVLMRWVEDFFDSAGMYNLPIWSDYSNHIKSTAVRFSTSTYWPIPKNNISNLGIAGTDNTLTLINHPSKVSFSKNTIATKTIFDLSEKFIKPNLPVGSTVNGHSYIEHVSFDSGSLHRYVYAINKDYVNTGFGFNWYYSGNSSYENLAFCRVVEVQSDGNGGINYNVAIPLGFCFNINSSDGNKVFQKAAFTIPNGVYSTNQMNTIKLSLKIYSINKKEPWEFDGDNFDGLEFVVSVNDISNEGWLSYIDNHWLWTYGTAHEIPVQEMNYSGDGEYYVMFNEYRESNDNSLHFLRITLEGQAYNSLSGNNYGRMYAVLKLEYVGWPGPYFTNEMVAATFASSIGDKGNSDEYGGSGDELNITFNTRCGITNAVNDGAVVMPFNSFCNAQTYIDTQDREKIEINAAKFVRNQETNYIWDMVSSYSILKDGAKVYIPVAIGMNPRMNTVKLRLVSTNVS